MRLRYQEGSALQFEFQRRWMRNCAGDVSVSVRKMSTAARLVSFRFASLDRVEQEGRAGLENKKGAGVGASF